MRYLWCEATLLWPAMGNLVRSEFRYGLRNSARRGHTQERGVNGWTEENRALAAPRRSTVL
jgi:hypothetical protein